MKRAIQPYKVPEGIEVSKYEAILDDEVKAFEHLSDDETFNRMLEEIEEEYRSAVIDSPEAALEYRNILVTTRKIREFIITKLNLKKTFTQHAKNKKKV